MTPTPVDADALADDVTAHTLLNCLLREVCEPQGQARIDGGYVLLRLPRHDTTLRVRLRRAALAGSPAAHRFAGAVQVLGPAGWRPVGSQQLARTIAAELTLEHGTANPEFADQVRASRELIRRVLAARAAGHEPEPADPLGAYLASEQSLLYGHRFHPTPKARSGSVGTALRYAPEAGARFPLRILGVREDVAAADGDLAALDALGAGVPAGYAPLPVHPWQYALLRRGPELAQALSRDELVDLGPAGVPVVPTASVRTVYHPGAGAFLKLSLSVRITNCVRRNAAYELTGAVALTRLLRELSTDLATRYPGTVLLAEPGYRTAALPGLTDTVGVIVREGLPAVPGVTPLLAAAIADEHGPLLPRLLADTDPLDWWDRYVGLLVQPVLHAYFGHGVVTEPHLQNVVVGVRPDGIPARLFLRDLEGVKLLPHRLAAWRDALPEDVAAQLGYDEARGFDRVVYCLLVNHLGDLLARLADEHPRLEAAGWRVVRDQLARYEAAHGGPHTARLRDLLAGAPLPAKANLLTRWARLPDRAAGYLPLANPLLAPALAGR